MIWSKPWFIKIWVWLGVPTPSARKCYSPSASLHRTHSQKLIQYDPWYCIGWQIWLEPGTNLLAMFQASSVSIQWSFAQMPRRMQCTVTVVWHESQVMDRDKCIMHGWRNRLWPWHPPADYATGSPQPLCLLAVGGPGSLFPSNPNFDIFHMFYMCM